MSEFTLGVVESRFAHIVWERAPLTTKELVAVCEEQLQWKRTTTYTVLKKLCERGLFRMEQSLVTVVVSEEEFSARQSEQFVEDTFHGSLPAFIAAFTARKPLSAAERAEILRMMEEADVE